MLGDLLFLRWRPRHALRVASLLLVGASCQAAFIGSGLGTWGIGALELFAGICVTGAFTLWETSLGEHIPDRSLSRVSSYDYLSTNGVIPLGNLLAGARQRGVRHPRDAGRHDRARRRRLRSRWRCSRRVRTLPRGAQSA